MRVGVEDEREADPDSGSLDSEVLGVCSSLDGSCELPGVSFVDLKVKDRLKGNGWIGYASRPMWANNENSLGRE